MGTEAPSEGNDGNWVELYLPAGCFPPVLQPHAATTSPLPAAQPSSIRGLCAGGAAGVRQMGEGEPGAASPGGSEDGGTAQHMGLKLG